MSAHPAHLSSPKYRSDIDGLRALAVLPVVGFHAFPGFFRGGFIGVDVFFVISGFLISTIIFENLERGTFSLREFYARRIRRIFPALLLVLAACYVLGWLYLVSGEYKQLGKHIAGGAGFISNLILWNEAGYFDNASETKPLLHLWSLGIEEQFYIVWPLLLCLLWKMKNWVVPAMLLIAVGSLGYNIIGVYTDKVATFYSPQTRFWELMFGSLLAFFTLYRREAFLDTRLRLDSWLSAKLYKRAPDVPGRALRDVLSFAGFILLLVGFFAVSKKYHFPGFWALIPALGAVCLIAAGKDAPVNRRFLSHRFMVWVGLISFPLYLWHWPLLSFVQILEGATPHRLVRIGVVVVSLALAWFTYRVVEKPIRFGKRGAFKTGMLVMLMIAMGTAGYDVYRKEGIESRPVAERGAQITRAKADWHYESTKMADGKITELKIFKGQSDKRVIFVGSSLMGQYYPRVEHLYEGKIKPYLTTVFASRNHCTPMPEFDHISGPENINCKDYYHAALELAKDSSTVRVVFAANWPYLTENNQLTKQSELFISDIQNLRKLGKEVAIIGQPPIYREFNPSVLAKNLRRDISFEIDDNFVERLNIEDLGKLSELRTIAERSGAVLINPYDYLCDKKRCPMSRDGEPLYTDEAHMRASYAAKSATFVDDLVKR